jgi:hypothetical protein
MVALSWTLTVLVGCLSVKPFERVRRTGLDGAGEILSGLGLTPVISYRAIRVRIDNQNALRRLSCFGATLLALMLATPGHAQSLVEWIEGACSG